MNLISEHRRDGVAALDFEGCPVCASQDVELLLEIREIPTLCNVLWQTRSDALNVPFGDLELGFCSKCGHVYNYSFDPSRISYTQDYENSLHFSTRFQEYIGDLVDYLVERHDLREKRIIDIGCGKGDFLSALCKHGNNKGFGFDPSFDPALLDALAAESLTVIQDYYSEEYADCRADLICCRHVLEHVQNPSAFLQMVRRAIGGSIDVEVFFEVPNVQSTLKDLAIWDLIYEHCSYFSSTSLTKLFNSNGFHVTGVREAFGGQYLWLEANTAKANTKDRRALRSLTFFAPKDRFPTWSTLAPGNRASLYLGPVRRSCLRNSWLSIVLTSSCS